MDLLLLAQDVTWGGRTGDAVHLRELARGLAQRGHAVRVLARAGGESLAVSGVEVLPIASRMNLGVRAFRAPVVARALVRAVRRRRPDLVYSRSFGDVAEIRTTRALGLPIVFEVNGDAIAERESQSGRRLAVRSFQVRSARAGFRSARLVVAVTDTLRQRLVEEYRVPAQQIVVVPNAADTERFSPRPGETFRRALGLPAGEPVVGFVGNLAPWQGVDVLLRAFAIILRSLPRAWLLVVGDGQALSDLRSLGQELGIESRVRFVGAVPYERVPECIAAMDVGTAPMTRERLRSGSSAIKVYEYLACERPVVASRIPGLEFVEVEDLGRLVPPEDAASLAEALASALRDGPWRRSAGERGRAYVLRQAGWPAVAAAVERVCREAIAG